MPHTATLVPESQLDAALKALAAEPRRRILRILASSTPEAGKDCCDPNEVCACKLAEQLGLAASTISHHMAVLRDAGLVEARKDGLWTYYSLRRDHLKRVAAELATL